LDPQGGRERFEDGGLHGEISASGVERSRNLAVAKAVICLFLLGLLHVIRRVGGFITNSKPIVKIRVGLIG
jgi:hypothetical protein